MSSKKEASCSNQQLASFYHIANNLSLGSLTQTIDTGYYTVVDALKKHSVAHIVVRTGLGRTRISSLDEQQSVGQGCA